MICWNARLKPLEAKVDLSSLASLSPKTARVSASVLLMGVPGEADERGVGQGLPQVAGEPVGHLAGLLIDLAGDPSARNCLTGCLHFLAELPQAFHQSRHLRFYVEGCFTKPSLHRKIVINRHLKDT